MPLTEKARRLFFGAPPTISLSDLLSHAATKMDRHERMIWFEELLLWLRKDDASGGQVRFRLFFQVLEQNPKLRADLQTAVAALLTECRFLDFFTHTGYAPEHGLWSDLASRVFRKVIPAAGTGDIREIILNVFKTERNIAWLTHLSEEDLVRLQALFTEGDLPRLWASKRAEIEEALLVLSTHIAHHGLSLSIRHRIDSRRSIAEFSFVRLAAVIQGRSLDQTELPVTLEEAIEECRQDVATTYRKIETSGVSVDLVHKLEVISALLDQIELLIALDEEGSERELLRHIQGYLITVARAGIRGRSIREHVNRHFYLLAQKIAERNGDSGEHYVARDAGETLKLYRAAIGGGVVVVAMIVAKTFVIRAEPAPVFLALGIWIVYSTGFLTMQFRGYSLATKIPSFTASLLARKLKETQSHQDGSELYDELRHIFRSQLVGLLGNLTGVIPIAIGADLLARAIFRGHGLMNDHYAHHTLEDLNPIASTVILMGALTGVVLWASSICGGWFENWVSYNGLAETLEFHPRLRRLIGIAGTQRLAKSLKHHASALATNIALGFFFGFVPFFGNAFGLNLDGKHVTISTAASIFALSAFHFDVEPRVWVWTALGLLSVGVLNFLVSFVLALTVAARSQKLRMPWVWRNLLSSRRRLKQHQKQLRRLAKQPPL